MKKRDKNQLFLEMSYRELLYNLIVSQLLFLFLGLGIGYLYFHSFFFWVDLLSFSIKEILLFGIVPGLLVIVIDWFLMKIFPKRYFDDGGLNKKLFSEAPVWHIFFIALFVAVCEEILFRGLLQTTLGLPAASLLFALIHFRYLLKPLLLFSVLLLSFSLGILFQFTGNLLVPILMHFVIDFLSGFLIRKEKEV